MSLGDGLVRALESIQLSGSDDSKQNNNSMTNKRREQQSAPVPQRRSYATRSCTSENNVLTHDKGIDGYLQPSNGSSTRATGNARPLASEIQIHELNRGVPLTLLEAGRSTLTAGHTSPVQATLSAPTAFSQHNLDGFISVPATPSHTNTHCSVSRQNARSMLPPTLNSTQRLPVLSNASVTNITVRSADACHVGDTCTTNEKAHAHANQIRHKEQKKKEQKKKKPDTTFQGPQPQVPTEEQLLGSWQSPAPPNNVTAPKLNAEQIQGAAQSSTRKLRKPYLHMMPRPDPTSFYLQAATGNLKTRPAKQELLVVLDLNGTLLYRKRKGGSDFVRRPGVESFIEYLFECHNVMVWSSARPQNVIDMCSQLFSAEQNKNLVAIWSRDRLRLSPQAYNERAQVYKQLSWVWDDPGIRAVSSLRNCSAWSQADTVLIDDSVEKAASEPFNLICVEEFEDRPDQQKPETLQQLTAYLEHLSLQHNVSSYIQQHPFISSHADM